MKNRLLGGALMLAALLGSAPAVAFQANPSLQAVVKEVAKRMTNGESVESIAVAAMAAGVSPSVLVTALVAEGADPAKVTTAMVAAGFSVKAVIAAATSVGAPAATIQTAAIAGGADPTAVLAATAAGPATGPAAAAQLGPVASSPGFAPSRFGITRAASVGGGGSGSVSPN